MTIKNSPVTRVYQYDYLGTTMASDLSWGANTKRLCKKASKRLYHLRKLREFRVSQQLQTLFYQSTIESVLVFAVAVWGGSLTQQDKKHIRQVKRCAERITGCTIPDWEPRYHACIQQMVRKLLKDKDHPLHPYYEYLPSGRRLRQPHTRTTRYRTSMVPNSIALVNSKKVTI